MNTVPSSHLPSFEGAKVVLLVDDNPTNLEVLIDALAESGLRLLVAEDGEAAIEQIQFVTPDIILLDIMMPCMDGFETCRRLKADARTQPIPVIFMTALNEIDHKVEGLSIGGVDYITKPIQPDEVLARVNIHLQLQELHRQLARQNVKLKNEINKREQAEHALKLFMRAVSHDLRNPVTGLILVVQNLLSSSLSQNQAETEMERSPNLPLESIPVARSILERMLDSAQHQLNLINSLLENQIFDPPEVNTNQLTSHYDSIILHRNSLKFHDLVIHVIQGLEPLFEKYRAQVDCAVSPELPSVDADANQLWRVLENLVTNAIKHNPHGVHVVIAAHIQDNDLVCEVSDDGKGIPLAEQSLLFAPYRRGSTQQNTPGLGLGLYLCQQIIQAHGGEIQLSSQPGHGATFRFTVPIAQEP